MLVNPATVKAHVRFVAMDDLNLQAIDKKEKERERQERLEAQSASAEERPSKNNKTA